jgi:Na+/H+-dicarboxylate symporter
MTRANLAALGRRLSGAGASLAGVALGMLAGLVLYPSSDPRLGAALAILQPVGALFVNGLQMTIIPLVLASVVVAIAAAPAPRAAGRLGGLAFLTFVGVLVIGALAPLVVLPLFLARVPPGAAAFDVAATGAIALQEPASTGSPSVPISVWTGVAGLLPANPVKAAADGDLLPLIVFAVVFGIAVSRLPDESRVPLVQLSRSLRDAMLGIVRGVLVLAPAGVFALALTATATLGAGVMAAVAYYLVLICGFLAGFTVVLYGVAMLVGGVRLGAFARAVAPAQAVALATRSSLASLPALMDGAARHLPVSPAVAGFMLPLSVAVFKAHAPLTGTVTFLLLARLYDIPVETGLFVSFLVVIFAASFTTPGTPGGGQLLTLPAYLAAGIPIEPLLLVGAVEAIPDIFKTLANVTADMAATAVVGRFAGLPTGGAAAPSGETQSVA